MPWIYQTSDGPKGPISDEELRRLVADGTIYEQTPIKKAGSNSDFVPAWNIKGLKFPEESQPEPETAVEVFKPLHPTLATRTKPPVPTPEVLNEKPLKPTMGAYYTPHIIEALWILSYICYIFLVAAAIFLIAVNGKESTLLALAYIFGGLFWLIGLRISLECVAVIFDISKYLRHLANK